MAWYMIPPIICIIAFLGGVAYRMGGSGNYPRWTRLVGQGVAVVAVMAFLGLIWASWKPILGVVLMFGACFGESTYWKKKGTDAMWYNWALVGLVFGLIPLPWCALTQSHWLGFGIRVPICVMLVVLWQEFLSAPFSKMVGIGKDVSDEVGRGFINVITLPLLLVG